MTRSFLKSNESYEILTQDAQKISSLARIRDKVDILPCISGRPWNERLGSRSLRYQKIQSASAPIYWTTQCAYQDLRFVQRHDSQRSPSSAEKCMEELLHFQSPGRYIVNICRLRRCRHSWPAYPTWLVCIKSVNPSHPGYHEQYIRHKWRFPFFYDLMVSKYYCHKTLFVKIHHSSSMVKPGLYIMLSRSINTQKEFKSCHPTQASWIF